MSKDSDQSYAHFDPAAVYNEAARLYGEDEVEGALEQAQLALTIYEQRADTELEQANCLLLIGMILHEIDSPEAMPSLGRGLELAVSVPDTEELQARFMLTMGSAALEQEQPELALTMLNAAFNAFTKAGDSDDEIVAVLVYLGYTYIELDDYELAGEVFTQAAELLTAQPDALFELAPIYLGLGTVYTELERHDEALSMLNQAAELYEAAGIGGDARAEVEVGLGYLYRAMGREADAVTAFNAAIGHYRDGSADEDSIEAVREALAEG